MTVQQVLVRVLGIGGLLLVLAGIVLRHRRRECFSFGLYTAAVLIPQVLETLNPERFYTRDFWLAKEATHQALKLAVALELTAHTVSAFPGARRTAQRVLLAILGMVLLVLLAGFSTPEWSAIVTALLPTALAGTVWIFCGLTFLILWYRLPVTDFQKAIVLGFVCYLLVYSIGLGLIGLLGWRTRSTVNLVMGIVHVLVTLYWAKAAWKRD